MPYKMLSTINCRVACGGNSEMGIVSRNKKGGQARPGPREDQSYRFFYLMTLPSASMT